MHIHNLAALQHTAACRQRPACLLPDAYCPAIHPSHRPSPPTWLCIHLAMHPFPPFRLYIHPCGRPMHAPRARKVRPRDAVLIEDDTPQLMNADDAQVPAQPSATCARCAADMQCMHVRTRPHMYACTWACASMQVCWYLCIWCMACYIGPHAFCMQCMRVLMCALACMCTCLHVVRWCTHAHAICGICHGKLNFSKIREQSI